ncbi:MAG: tyrosine-type recombinase/integrase [Actinomycetota bacterium]|nr:tyrosine-type recombinase/integrase [Actinomycetota bacterium]
MRLADRVEAKIDRSGEHHRWLGATDPRGVPVIKVEGRVTTVRRVIAELAGGGALPSGAKVGACPDDPLCVRTDHLQMNGVPVAPKPDRARKGSGSLSEIRPGVFKLSVVAGRHSDGTVRRSFRTFHGTRSEAARALAAFVAEVGDGSALPPPASKVMTLDELLRAYIDSCREDSDDNPKAWEASTLYRYDGIRRNWITPVIGDVKLANVSEEHIDRCFAKMRRLGASRSHMNQTRSLLSGAFKWARRRKLVGRNPLAGYELPKSKYQSHEVVPPEVEDLVALLNSAAEHIPDVAPVLSLAATTGMRRGELSGLRRSALDLNGGRLRVDRAVTDAGGQVVEKGTKTHQARWVSLDPATVELLARHLEDMEDRAALAGARVADDAFVFSLEADCSKPMRPDYMTRRTAQLRKNLGLAEGSFDATILALRKFTSTELMDAGFNPSLVSGRQGHTVQVMLQHYSKARRSADRAAAEHLGRRVHGGVANA